MFAAQVHGPGEGSVSWGENRKSLYIQPAHFMVMATPDSTSLDRMRVLDRLGAEIGRAVSELYTQVASDPHEPFHFPTGREAALLAGYAPVDLDEAPLPMVERFAGVGCPLPNAGLRAGDNVLDIGCGAGLDLWLSARQVGPQGNAVGIELTAAMAKTARDAMHESGVRNARVVEARAPKFQVDGPFDLITSNGVLNLIPEKERTLERLHALLRPGGTLTVADIVLARPPAVACLADAKLWAECLVGAYTEEAYVKALKDAGFTDLKIHSRRDYFSHSSSKKTRETAQDLGASAWELSARRPE